MPERIRPKTCGDCTEFFGLRVKEKEIVGMGTASKEEGIIEGICSHYYLLYVGDELEIIEEGKAVPSIITGLRWQDGDSVPTVILGSSEPPEDGRKGVSRSKWLG